PSRRRRRARRGESRPGDRRRAGGRPWRVLAPSRAPSANATAGLVARLETVRVAVDEPPLAGLEAKHVGHTIRPPGPPLGAGESEPSALGVRRHRQAGSGHRGEMLVAHRTAALELLSGPVPAPAHLGPALLVSAPAEERSDIVTVRVERLDRAGVTRHQRV